jgi:hypothetical protein
MLLPRAPAAALLVLLLSPLLLLLCSGEVYDLLLYPW